MLFLAKSKTCDDSDQRTRCVHMNFGQGWRFYMYISPFVILVCLIYNQFMLVYYKILMTIAASPLPKCYTSHDKCFQRPKSSLILSLLDQSIDDQINQLVTRPINL